MVLLPIRMVWLRARSTARPGKPYALARLPATPRPDRPGRCFPSPTHSPCAPGVARPARFCSTSRMAIPDPLISRRVSKMVRTSKGARPSDGSSSNRILGAAISARPMASICCSPPESVPASWLRRSRRRGNRLNTRCAMLLDACPLAAEAVGAHVQVFVHSEGREYLAPFGRVRDAQVDDLVGGHVTDRAACYPHIPLAGAEQPADGAQDRGFARAVRPNQRHDLPRPHGKRDPLEGMHVSVVGVDVLDFEHRITHLATSPGLRRGRGRLRSHAGWPAPPGACLRRSWRHCPAPPPGPRPP